MPYIKQEERVFLDEMIDHLAGNITSVGQLNYVITRIIHDKLRDNGVNYSNLNSYIGVLECAKLELYRKIASPYEEKKLRENNDIGVIPKELYETN